MGSKPKAPEPSAAQKELERQQLLAIEKERSEESKRVARLRAGRRGRASLISQPGSATLG